MPFKKCLPILLSFATGGAGINVGQKNGLRAILDSNRNFSYIQGPLFKMWCGVHSGEDNLHQT